MMKMTEMEVMLTNTGERGRCHEKRIRICKENDADCEAVPHGTVI